MAQSKCKWPVVRDVHFAGNDTMARPWEKSITVDKTGMYHLWFVACDSSLAAVTAEGATVWKNPTGDTLC